LGNAAEVYDIPKVLAKFGIQKVEQVIDILGLQGDSVDNIPGIPGIGEKTAQKLIAEFGSVENLVENAGKLTGKLKENVIKFGEQGIMSKKLATIHLDVNCVFDETTLSYSGPVKELLYPLLEELEFRTLKAKLFPDSKDPSAPKAEPKASKPGQLGLFDQPTDVFVEPEEAKETHSKKNHIDNISHSYYTVTEETKLKELAWYLSLQEEFCFDTETTGTDPLQADLVGLSFAYLKGEAFYIPLPEDKEEVLKVVSFFKLVFENPSIGKIGQNLKYDIQVLQNYNVEVKGVLFDTMLAHYLLEPDMRHGMDALSENYLHYRPISIETLIGKKGTSQGNMRQVEIEKISEYAAEDADITLQLKHQFAPLIKRSGLEKLLLDVETPLVQVLADIERAGINVDTKALAEYSVSLEMDVKQTEREVYEIAGESFNIASPKQLGLVLFDKLKIDPKAKKTSSGQYATGEEVLSKLAFEHPVVDKILQYRELQKLRSTYVDALPLMISPVDQRIHTSFNQAVAATGRLSSTNPNLQNIPIRTDRGKEIRKAFIPRDKEHVILSADYSQIELRIMASFCKDETMIDAFRNGRDIHASTASKIFKVPVGEVTGDMRRKAKTANFGIIYGISAFGLSQRLNIPRKEATEIIDNYFLEFPAVKRYMDEAINQGREKGYVETILNRKRYLRDINSANFTIRGAAERNAINAPIQGSAADIIKVAMIHIHHWMKQEKLKSHMVLQVHDELVFDAHLSEVDLLKAKVEELMKNALPLEVPMEVGLGVGANWLEAH
jgi:DNA polymerase-1